MTDTPQNGPPQPRGWKALTIDERNALTPLEKARAKAIDYQARSDAARKQVAELEKAEAKRRAARDTQRKIVAGAVLLDWAARPVIPDEDGQEDRARWVRDLLDEHLTRDRDRALFDLPPLEDGDNHAH